MTMERIETSKMIMPAYMLPHFDNAIKKAKKQTNRLSEYDYGFYASEEIYSEITGDVRYNGRNVYTVRGLRVRMSTMRQSRECTLRGSDFDIIKFTIPKTSSSTIDQIMARRIMQDPPFKQFEWVFQKLLCFIDWLNNLAGAEKPKEKTNGEQMLTLGELFEGYEDIDREYGTDHIIGRQGDNG